MLFVRCIHLVLCVLPLQSCRRTTLCLLSSQSSWTCWSSCCAESREKVWTKPWLGSLSMKPSSTWSTDTLARWVKISLLHCSRVTSYKSVKWETPICWIVSTKKENFKLISSRLVCFSLIYFDEVTLWWCSLFLIHCYTQFSQLITQHTH